jgi:hypothetical protein
MQLDTTLVVQPPHQRAAPIACEERLAGVDAGSSLCLKGAARP